MIRLPRHRRTSVGLIPPRSTAVPTGTAQTASTQRDRPIAIIAQQGRIGGAMNYGCRPLVEVATLRYKVVNGLTLRAGTLPTQ